MSLFFGTGGGAGGLSEVTQAIANNQTNTNITELNFDSSTVKRAIIYMSYNRTMSGGGVVRQGLEMEMLYDGSAWSLIEGEKSADVTDGITFDNDGGQVRYSSDDQSPNGTGNFSYYVREFSE
jgi:hypothetical protein